MTVFVCLFQLRHVCSNTEDRRYLYIRHHHPHCPWLWCVCETEPPEGLHCQGAQCQLYQRELQPHLAVPCFCRTHLALLSGLCTLFSLLWLSFPRGNARRFSVKITLITSPRFCLVYWYKYKQTKLDMVVHAFSPSIRRQRKESSGCSRPARAAQWDPIFKKNNIK